MTDSMYAFANSYQQPTSTMKGAQQPQLGIYIIICIVIQARFLRSTVQVLVTPFHDKLPLVLAATTTNTDSATAYSHSIEYIPIGIISLGKISHEGIIVVFDRVDFLGLQFESETSCAYK